MEGDFKAARELISYNRLSNTEKKNDLILNEKTTKSKAKSLGVSRQMAESIDALVNAQHKNFSLRTRIEELDRRGVNVYKLRHKYGELNSAQSERQFGDFKNISRELDLQLKKEERKWRWMNKQNKELERRRKYSVRMGGAKSRLRGDSILDVGSPAYNDRLAKEGGPRSRLNYRGGRLLPGPAGTGGRGGSSVWQSAAISGAFPLLFGQGPVTAAAGAVGGGLGAKFGGQMGGFAGGLIATSAAQQVAAFSASVTNLGAALAPSTANVGSLTKSLGLNNTELGKNIQQLEKLGGKEAALALAREEMARLVGEKNVAALERLGKTASTLSNEWAKAITTLQSKFAGFINAILTGPAEGLTTKNLLSQAKQTAAGGDTEMASLLEELRKARAVENSSLGIGGIGLRNKKDILKDILDKQKDINKVVADETAERVLQEQLTAKKLKLLNDMYANIGDTVKTGLVDGISAAIEGTKNLGEVAGSVLRDIGRTILQFGLTSFLGSLFPKNKVWQKMFGFADGGRPPKGRPSIVGERGPELFVPDSSGTIVPNHAMGGSMVVNVDASGSSAEGDDDRSRQLGELIGAAVQSEIIRQQRPGGTLY
jgi:hypothetical protein